MAIVLKITLIALCFLASNSTWAAESKEAKKPFSGWITAGRYKYLMQYPPDTDRNDGTIVGFTKDYRIRPNFYFITSGELIWTNGYTNYTFKRWDGVMIQVPQVLGTTQMFHLLLGLRIRIIDDFPLHPYIEGGGAFGPHQELYHFTNLQTVTIVAQGGAQKNWEMVWEWGHYFEGGLDIVIGNFGLKAAYRYLELKTQDLSSIGENSFKHIGQAALGGIYWGF